MVIVRYTYFYDTLYATYQCECDAFLNTCSFATRLCAPNTAHRDAASTSCRECRAQSQKNSARVRIRPANAQRKARRKHSKQRAHKTQSNATHGTARVAPNHARHLPSPPARAVDTPRRVDARRQHLRHKSVRKPSARLVCGRAGGRSSCRGGRAVRCRPGSTTRQGPCRRPTTCRRG